LIFAAIYEKMHITRQEPGRQLPVLI